jgi:hypothetical protein
MKQVRARVKIAALAAAIALAGTSVSLAQEAPSLVGTWSGDYRTMIYHPEETRTGQASMTLTITEQDGELLTGSHAWELDAANEGDPDIRGEAVRGGSEDLIGVISVDGTEIRLLETRDNGTFEATIVDENTLHAVYVEQQHDEATVFRVVLKRTGD